MRTLSILFFSLWSLFAVAADTVVSDPNQVLHTVSASTFARISAERAKLETQPEYMQVIIEEELLPHFDYKYAAYKVMGAHLKKTTREQRDEFTEAFKSHLANAYGHILFEYDQQELEILDTAHFKDKKIIAIPVRIHDENEKVTQISFKLRKNKKTGEWKVFDVIAEGISMLNTKQSEFNELIHKKGIDHVINLLNQKNSEF